MTQEVRDFYDEHAKMEWDRADDPAFLQSMLDQGGLGIWYWSNPVRAQAEARSAGFEIITYAGAEGCAGGIKPLITTLAFGAKEK